MDGIAQEAGDGDSDQRTGDLGAVFGKDLADQNRNADGSVLHDAAHDLHHDLGQAVENVEHGAGDPADALILGDLHVGQAEAKNQGEEDDLQHRLVDQGGQHAGGDDVGNDVPDIGLGSLAGSFCGHLGDLGQFRVGLEDVAHQQADDDAEGRGDQIHHNDPDTHLADGGRGDRGRADYQRAHDHRDDDHFQEPCEDGAEYADPWGKCGDS